MKIIYKKTTMKKNLLLMMLCMPVVLAAQNGDGVAVSGLAVDAGTVTFNVSWDKNNPSDTVWVFVDYNDAGVMKRLPVTGATVSAGTVTKIPNNDKGVWVEGNARANDSFSATVELFTEIKDVAGACAYASNYPPVGEYKNNATEISFTGTPMYEIQLAHSGGESATVKSGDTFLLPCDYTLASFTDATGAPGRLSCISPAAYTLSGADVCEGTDVTLTLSGSESGWRYQLYKDNIPVGSENEGTGSALTFSEASTIAGRFSYMVRTVDATGAQCEMQVSNVHAIMVKPVPTITRSGGDASQTVYQYIAIDTIVYMASDAATISWTGGNFPIGVTGVPSGNPYTISGMPTATGIAGYSLTANMGGCISPPSVGTITVTVCPPPPYAESAKTWTVGTQIWSDFIIDPACDHDAFANTSKVMECRSHVLNGKKLFYFNRAYVWLKRAAICPSPWRLPLIEDFVDLDVALGGTGEARATTSAWIDATYVGIWGATRGAGFAGAPCEANTMCNLGGPDYIWSNTTNQYGGAYALVLRANAEVAWLVPNYQPGYRVRCVK
jgi:uncharacterized protein (TIGR02145 family)